MTTTSEPKTRNVLRDLHEVWQEMQGDPFFQSMHEFDEAMKHLRRAQAFLKLDQIQSQTVSPAAIQIGEQLAVLLRLGVGDSDERPAVGK